MSDEDERAGRGDRNRRQHDRAGAAGAEREVEDRARAAVDTKVPAGQDEAGVRDRADRLRRRTRRGCDSVLLRCLKGSMRRFTRRDPHRRLDIRGRLHDGPGRDRRHERHEQAPPERRMPCLLSPGRRRLRDRGTTGLCERRIRDRRGRSGPPPLRNRRFPSAHGDLFGALRAAREPIASTTPLSPHPRLPAICDEFFPPAPLPRRDGTRSVVPAPSTERD
jgi:hypothetical protein